MYCLCSNSSFDDILERQRIEPLSRAEMIERHTGCAQGCGSCIDALLAEAEMLDLLSGETATCAS